MSVMSTQIFVFVCVSFVLGTILYVFCNSLDIKSLKHVEQYQQADGFTIKNDIQDTNKDVSDCRARNLTYITKTPDFAMVALLSYPGSGNTWTRHLLQQLTGFYTGSVYTNALLQRNGFLGEQVSARHRSKGCLVYKSHRQTDKEPFDKAIILIRNPFKALKAFYNYRFGLKPENHQNRFFRVVDRSDYTSSRWLKFTETECNKWQNSYASWLKTFENRFLLVRYTDLKYDLNRTLKRISKFLRLRPSQRDYRCTYLNQEGNFHRKQKYDLGISDIYNDKQINMINDAVRNVMQIAKKHNNLKDYLYDKK